MNLKAEHEIHLFFFLSLSPFYRTVGLESLNGFQENKSTSPNNEKLPAEANASSIPMEIDADETASDIQSSANDATTVPPVDLESELREFLESDTTSLAAAAADDVGLDQMLMA